MSDAYNQALQLFDAHKVTKAAEAFKNILEHQPQNHEAKYKLGICLYRQKEFKNAEEIFRTLTANDNQHFEAWYYYGLSLERQNKTEQAINAYKIALVAKPDFNAAIKKLDSLGDLQQTNSSEAPDEQLESGPGKVLYAERHRRMGSFNKHLTSLFILSILIAIGCLITLEIKHPDEGLIVVAIVALLFLFLVVLVDLILRSRTHKYIIYERRIDIKKGILFRSHKSIWLYEIMNVTFKQTPWLLITRNAKIRLSTSNGTFVLQGFSSIKLMRNLFDELRNSILEQRGEIKKIFI